MDAKITPQRETEIKREKDKDRDIYGDKNRNRKIQRYIQRRK